MVARRTTHLMPLLLAAISSTGHLSADAPQGAKNAPIPIQGVVVDSKGEPVDGARLGTGWWFDADRLSAYGGQRMWPAESSLEQNGWSFVEADSHGVFDACIQPRRGKTQVIAFSPDSELAGAFVWDQKEDVSKLRLVLEPTAHLQATITCNELGLREIPATAYLRSFDGRRIGRFHADKGKVDVILPAGHYQLYLYGAGGQDIGSRKFNFAVAAGEQATARDIDIPANEIARMRGRRMPAIQADAARGVELTNATFENFRGKWLLVHIWKLENTAPRRSFPRVIKFDQDWRTQHPNQEPPYQILLLHRGGPKTFAEYDAKVAKLGHRETHWSGKPLPFPILLDPDERTAKSWKTRWSEQALLFDPDGKLWGDTDLDSELAKIAAGTLKPAKPTQLRKPKAGGK